MGGRSNVVSALLVVSVAGPYWVATFPAHKDNRAIRTLTICQSKSGQIHAWGRFDIPARASEVIFKPVRLVSGYDCRTTIDLMRGTTMVPEENYVVETVQGPEDKNS